MFASYVFMNCSKLYIQSTKDLCKDCSQTVFVQGLLTDSICARIAHRQYGVAFPARYIHGLCIAEAFGSQTMLIHMHC